MTAARSVHQHRERFEAKVSREPCGCHLWTGARNSKGYGRFSLEGRNRIAQRVAWELYRGPIPKGMQVCHHCDNPPCVHPEHLFLGTPADNLLDMQVKERGNYRNGESHPKAKLTLDAVKAIRRSSLTNTELGRLYGVTRMAIAFIRDGTNWRHT